MPRCASSLSASCPAPALSRFLGAGLHLSQLSQFRGPAHLEVRAKWLRLPVRLVESSIDGHTIALTGDGELGDSLTRFISDRGLEVRPNSSAFVRLKRECQILHHERTGGYYHEIGARQNATNKILDAIDNLEVEPQQLAALIEGTPVRQASTTGRALPYKWS